MRRAMASAGLLTLLLAARPLSAKEILIPNVVAFARGSYSSLWGTEIRIINPTSSPKSFRVVDWIGSPRQRPYQVTVLPGETVVRGGFGLYTALWQQSPVLRVLDEAEYGAAVCEVDEGLLVLSRMLTTTVVDPPGLAGQGVCAPNAGEYVYGDALFLGVCNYGVGPVLYADRSFFDPGVPQNLLMLNPRRNHYRTNLVIVNGDDEEATVSILVTNATGGTARLERRVPARTYFQMNDVYALPELSGLEELSEMTEHFGQRAVVTCSTRCYAIGYVISNHNNTVSVVEPR